MDAQGGSPGQVPSGNILNPGNQGQNTDYFSFALSPASVYAGDNRVIGLVRARSSPFNLRAFDWAGNPLGPTVTASAMDGYQVVDYGPLRIPPWMATAVITVRGLSLIGDPVPNGNTSVSQASGMFLPVRSQVMWGKEHGPIFVLPITVPSSTWTFRVSR
jgi:hypothetical protein